MNIENNFEKQRQFDMRREKESEFTDENWMIRVNNELHSEYLPINSEQEESRPENHLHLLEEAEKYYQDIGDDFNLFRLKLKRGDLEEAKKMAEEFLRKKEEPNFLSHYTTKSEEMEKVDILELKKAYVLSDLAKYKKNENLEKQAAKKFISFAEKQSEHKKLFGYEASALGFWQARSFLSGNEKDFISEKCISQFRKVVDDRAKVNDRWWESIALRQIGKISKIPEDKKIVLQRLEELIKEYKEMGDYKKAALWARDVNDLNSTKENAQRMEKLWDENIKKMQANGDTRAVGKSFWSLYKRIKKYDVKKAEEYRLQTIEWYRKLLQEEKAKEKPREDKIRECYWVFCELIQ